MDFEIWADIYLHAVVFIYLKYFYSWITELQLFADDWECGKEILKCWKAWNGPAK